MDEEFDDVDEELKYNQWTKYYWIYILFFYGSTLGALISLSYLRWWRE